MKGKQKRNCEICGYKKNTEIYTQRFLLGDNVRFRYKVVACDSCGFTFATDLPSPSKLEKFYKENTKYVYQHSGGTIPEFAKKLHLHSFKMVDKYLKKNYFKNKNAIKILDIGCGNAYLLNIFKQHGYSNLLGIEPAKGCSIVARRLYRIKVLPMTLSEYSTKEKFDLIILGSVLEHLSILQKNSLKAVALLKDSGIMFVSVPDGDHFGSILKEPFLEFSLEHINYFTRNSLKNLFAPGGMKNSKFDSLPLDLYGGYALNSIWKKDDKKRRIVFKKSDKKKIDNYIKKSRAKLQTIENKIEKLVNSQEKLIVWGVGSLTSRLLATTDLKKTNVQFFVDSNKNLQGNKINNIKIEPPEVLKNGKITVFVSTYIYGREIKETLLKRYHFKGKIILL